MKIFESILMGELIRSILMIALGKSAVVQQIEEYAPWNLKKKKKKTLTQELLVLE